MANQNCASCDNLNTYSPNVVVNGIGAAECTSLKNDTGLRPASGHNDCTDLDHMNNCFIGNMEDEIENHDVCDWREFMKMFSANVWTVFKGVICAICGIWTNIHNLWSRIAELAEVIENICKLQEATVQHPVYTYGTLPNGSASRRGGTLGTKNGSTILVALQHSEVSDAVWLAQNVGISYGKLNVESCETGSCVRHEWISPNILGYKFNQTPAPGDVLWSCSKSVAQNTFGITDEQWAAKVANAVGWFTDWSTGNALISLRLGVTGNNLELSFIYAIGVSSLSDLNGRTIQAPGSQPERLYRFPC